MLWFPFICILKVQHAYSLRKLRQEDWHEFKVSLGYRITSPVSKKTGVEGGRKACRERNLCRLMNPLNPDT